MQLAIAVLLILISSAPAARSEPGLAGDDRVIMEVIINGRVNDADPGLRAGSELRSPLDCAAPN
jgi:hypothetical protein